MNFEIFLLQKSVENIFFLVATNSFKFCKFQQKLESSALFTQVSIFLTFHTFFPQFLETYPYKLHYSYWFLHPTTSSTAIVPNYSQVQCLFYHIGNIATTYLVT